MSVLRLTSKKTLPILIQALSRLKFSQTEISKETNISIGRVNKVVSWLKQKDLLVKEHGKYVITQPNRLADLIASQQNLVKKRTYHVSLTKKQAIKQLKKNNATFCLQSALEMQTKQELQQELQIISGNQAQDFLNTLPRGGQIITLYEYEAMVEQTTITDKVRTIIDLKTIGVGYLADTLAMKLWGTMQ